MEISVDTSRMDRYQDISDKVVLRMTYPLHVVLDLSEVVRERQLSYTLMKVIKSK